MTIDSEFSRAVVEVALDAAINYFDIAGIAEIAAPA